MHLQRQRNNNVATMHAEAEQQHTILPATYSIRRRCGRVGCVSLPACTPTTIQGKRGIKQTSHTRADSPDPPAPPQQHTESEKKDKKADEIRRI